MRRGLQSDTHLMPLLFLLIIFPTTRYHVTQTSLARHISHAHLTVVGRGQVRAEEHEGAGGPRGELQAEGLRGGVGQLLLGCFIGE